MSFKETVARWFSQGMPDNFDAGVQPEEPPVANPTPAPSGNIATPRAEADASATSEMEALRAESARYRAEAEALRAAQLQHVESAAQAFAESLVASNKILPYEAALVARHYADLAKLDASDPYPAEGIRAEADGQGAVVHSRVGAMRLMFANRPAHAFTAERLVVPDRAEQSGFRLVDNGAAGGKDVASLAYEQGKRAAEKANGRKS
jgi:hypothetical protein